MKTYTVNMHFEEDMWFTKTCDDLSLNLNSGSFDALVERVKIAAPEMLALNCQYTGPIQLIFETKRTETLRASA